MSRWFLNRLALVLVIGRHILRGGGIDVRQQHRKDLVSGRSMSRPIHNLFLFICVSLRSDIYQEGRYSENNFSPSTSENANLLWLAGPGGSIWVDNLSLFCRSTGDSMYEVRGHTIRGTACVFINGLLHFGVVANSSRQLPHQNVAIIRPFTLYVATGIDCETEKALKLNTK